jgi:hypothetical protein
VLYVLSRRASQNRATVRFPSLSCDGKGIIGEMTVGHVAHAQPARPSAWIFGEAGGVQVWAAEGDSRVRVAVLVGDGPPVIVVNRRLMGTPAEHGAVCWALRQVAERGTGFYVLRSD